MSPEERMTNEQIAEIRQYCEAATPGPCEPRYVHDGMPSHPLHFGVVSTAVSYETGRNWRQEDAVFDASARTDLPLALTALEEARRRVGELEAKLRAAEEVYAMAGEHSCGLDRRIATLERALAECEAKGVEARERYRWRPISEIHEDYGDVVMVNMTDEFTGFYIGSNLHFDFNEADWTHFARFAPIGQNEYNAMKAEIDAARKEPK